MPSDQPKSAKEQSNLPSSSTLRSRYDKELEERLYPLDEVELQRRRKKNAEQLKQLSLEEMSTLLNLPVETQRRTQNASADRDAVPGRRPSEGRGATHGGDKAAGDQAESGSSAERSAEEASRGAPDSGCTADPATSRRVADEADEEVQMYVFAGHGRRGTDSLVSQQP
jgi:hypothetical protein